MSTKVTPQTATPEIKVETTTSGSKWYKNKWVVTGGAIIAIIVILLVLMFVLSSVCKKSNSAACAIPKAAAKMFKFLGDNIKNIFFIVIALIFGFATGAFALMKRMAEGIGDGFKDFVKKFNKDKPEPPDTESPDTEPPDTEQPDTEPPDTEPVEPPESTNPWGPPEGESSVTQAPFFGTMGQRKSFPKVVAPIPPKRCT